MPIDPPRIPKAPTRSKINPITAPAAPIPPVSSRVESIPLRIVPRVTVPDLTGLYESVPVNEGENPAIMLQLNQVGKVVVGWFTPPPDFVPKLSNTLSRSAEQNRYKMSQGVLIAYYRDRRSDGIPFTWIKSPFQKFNQLDPDEDLLPETESNSALNGGLLQIVTQPNSNFFQELLLKFDLNSSNFDRFVRVKSIARWSFLNIQFIPSEVRDLVIAEQVNPVPSSYLNTIRKRVAPTGEPPQIPLVAKLLEEWRNGDKFVKTIKREAIANEVDDYALLSPLHRELVASLIRAHAASKFLQITIKSITGDISETKTYLEWFKEVVAEEKDILATNYGMVSIVVPKFERAGINPTSIYRYTMTFEKLGFEAQRVFKIGVVAFRLNVKKEKLEYEREGAEYKRDKKGRLIVKSKEVKFDTSKENYRINGAFFNAGSGLGISSKLIEDDSSAKPKLEGKSKESLIDVEFESFQDILLEDFRGATFKIASVKAPGASVGNYVSYDTFTSTFFDFSFKNNAVLSKVVEETSQFSPPKKPSYNDIKDLEKIKKYAKGWLQPNIDARLFDLSLGYGILLDQDQVSQATKNTNNSSTPASFSSKGTRLIEAFFKVDSAQINEATREAFEVVLAVERALFDTANGKLRAFGYASPEADKEYNRVLSQKRAEAVIQAVKDAFGNDLKITDLKAIGLGEEIALRNGLRDPEASALPLDEWIKANPQEVKEWHKWRRVDLEVEGLLVARLLEEP